MRVVPVISKDGRHHGITQKARNDVTRKQLALMKKITIRLMTPAGAAKKKAGASSDTQMKLVLQPFR